MEAVILILSDARGSLFRAILSATNQETLTKIIACRGDYPMITVVAGKAPLTLV